MKILIIFLFFLISFVKAEQVNDLPLPMDYERLEFSEKSFSRWVQNMPLKDDKSIKSYVGQELQSFYNVFAVIDLPLLFTSDLEQCADYAMRLWAEYHKSTEKEEDLYLFNYNGSKKMFSSGDFESFLRQAMASSNSYSLKMGCTIITYEQDLIPGDMLVQNETGGIGHVSVILDICENSAGKRLYLIGYSFMPAQEMHIERALQGMGENGWFTLEGYNKYLDLILPFGTPVFRRF